MITHDVNTQPNLDHKVKKLPGNDFCLHFFTSVTAIAFMLVTPSFAILIKDNRN